MLVTGDTAPRIQGPDHDENHIDTNAMRGRRIFVYFYPKADTPGCTAQACGLRDVLDQAGDVVVLGVSPDRPSALKRFRDKYSLGFSLVSDADHAIAEAYGVWQEKKMYGRTYMGVVRSAFLIDAEGRIERTWYKISPAATPEALLESVR